MRLVHAIAALLVLAAAGCVTSPAQNTRGPLIVISLDGFRADYLDRGLTPTLSALAADGVRATAMRPSFPSVTQPNHYTLMTGLTPDHHGIVDNTMVDAALPGWFGGPDPAVPMDPRWWEQATPLWVTAERQGIRTGSSAWPGSEVAIHGLRPARLDPWVPGILPAAQVDTVLPWLDLPEAERPRLLVLHFSPVDEAGHVWGPDSEQVNAALREVDAAIARLIDGLKARGLADTANIVVVSDHGMMPVSAERVVLIDDFVDVKTLIPATYGAVIGVIPKPGHEAAVAAAMLKPHDHLTCWRKSAIPAHLRYGTNARVPPFFCLAEPGWLVLTRELGLAGQQAYPDGFRGNHGYDPAAPEMAALFLARGPAFREGVTLAPFDNVDVYPLLARLLGVPPEPNDGNPETLKPALR